MKLKTKLCILLCCICSTVAHAQEIHVQPTPQQIKVSGGNIILPRNYQLNGAAEADAEAIGILKKLLSSKQEDNNGQFRIYIGEKGDKAIKKYAKFIPNVAEGYYLLADNKQLVIAGNDETGTFYALQTLSQLLKGDTIPCVEIKDYPDIRYRGVVEGFYGIPWSYEDRISQLQFYGKFKMNTYIYGPKDDPYHSSPNWRLPYPEKEAAQLSNLVKVAKENKVDFVWAIHPGQDIKWNDTDRNHLLAKFENMYQMGVRSFAVFFDDITGEGTDPSRQAELLNYLNEHFVKVKKDISQLIICPTIYNKGWSKSKKDYLPTLGKELNPSIQIMWTGDQVVTDITKQGLQWVNRQINRPAYVWWNFPVTDFARDHVVMGEIYGMDKSIKKDMSGFMSNPMEHAEASKVAIFGIASYTWNLAQYDSRQAWEDVIKVLMPENTEALRTFVMHNSDLGPNGHNYRRVESANIKPVADKFLSDYKQGQLNKEDCKILNDEFERIIEASDILLTSKDNTALVKDITPWIYQFKVSGEMGTEVFSMLEALEAKNTDLFMRKYNHLQALREQSIRISKSYNVNPYQPGIKTGSLVLEPLINEVFKIATGCFNIKYGKQLNDDLSYDIKKYTGTMEEAKTE